jgi:hypothetical protein
VRLRPILMTTLAMVFGMVPLAFALTEGSEQRAPMGQAVIGGVITSSLLTLVVVPVIYCWLDDLAAWARRRARPACAGIRQGLKGERLEFPRPDPTYPAPYIMNIEIARFNMIEQQIRPWEVLDPHVLSLLATVRREDFVPPACVRWPSSTPRCPCCRGSPTARACWSPRVEARLLQELQVQRHEKVLEIGTGSGFMAALLAHRAQQVSRWNATRRWPAPRAPTCAATASERAGARRERRRRHAACRPRRRSTSSCCRARWPRCRRRCSTS